MRRNLHILYKEQVVPALYKDFGYKNIEEVPKVLKISINRGLGEDSRNSKELEANLREMATISGQYPIINKARKSIAGFKIRDGMPVGASVTLRREKMYAFLERLIHITLPRIRDFRGINAEGFDGRGNYNLGIKDQLIFPEISYDDVTQLQGFDIAITTSAKTDEEAYSLLRRLGMPLKVV
uniref:ribosomal protein L5 n=1 Tax=Ochrosphaera neapolitana TaxID=35137 RepID=UPI00286D44C4|nr:ribosomal protein L5 [Ochrosphaera neapolitana]WKK50127.1 ribosomal protein L5 [Ochrosphaera neapolitana]